MCTALIVLCRQECLQTFLPFSPHSLDRRSENRAKHQKPSDDALDILQSLVSGCAVKFSIEPQVSHCAHTVGSCTHMRQPLLCHSRNKSTHALLRQQLVTKTFVTIYQVHKLTRHFTNLNSHTTKASPTLHRGSCKTAENSKCIRPSLKPRQSTSTACRPCHKPTQASPAISLITDCAMTNRWISEVPSYISVMRASLHAALLRCVS
jgi:hypothetical protein